MARSLKIRGEEVEITVEVGAGPTAEALWEILPLESRASLWGEEIYFQIPLSVEANPTPGTRSRSAPPPIGRRATPCASSSDPPPRVPGYANTKVPEVMFRALLAEGGAERLELARA